MTTKINRPPSGLQWLLGTQSFGKNPDQLSLVTLPTIEQLPFLGVQTQQVSRDTVTANARGPWCSIEVPDGEYWIPIQAAFRSIGVQTAGDSLSMSIQVGDLPGAGSLATSGGIVLASSPLQTAVAVGDVFKLAWTAPSTFLVAGQTRFRGFLDSYNPGGLADINVDLMIWYYRLPGG